MTCDGSATRKDVLALSTPPDQTAFSVTAPEPMPSTRTFAVGVVTRAANESPTTKAAGPVRVQVALASVMVENVLMTMVSPAIMLWAGDNANGTLYVPPPPPPMPQQSQEPPEPVVVDGSHAVVLSASRAAATMTSGRVFMRPNVRVEPKGKDHPIYVGDYCDYVSEAKKRPQHVRWNQSGVRGMLGRFGDARQSEDA